MVKWLYDICLNTGTIDILKNNLTSLINHQTNHSLFLAERLVTLTNNDPIATFILAECYYQLGDYVKVNYVLHKNNFVLIDENFLLITLRSLYKLG